MTREEIFKEFKTLSERIFALECKLSNYIETVHSTSSESINEIKEDIQMIKSEIGLSDTSDNEETGEE